MINVRREDAIVTAKNLKDCRHFIGIDIGSTATKVVVLDDHEILETMVLPTGWSSVEVAEEVRERLESRDYFIPESYVVATGYGRVAVDFADRTVTEITCHGRGGYELMGQDGTMIDIGGQDTKTITVENGLPKSFLMNDKCSAGTGKFLEIMANRLGVSLPDLFDLAARGTVLPISAMCTVFAESEVISHIGNGEKREDIAAGVVDSVIRRVAGLAMRHGLEGQKIFLTGGLSGSDFIVESLSRELGMPVHTHPTMGRYAGALGAALLGRQKILKIRG